MAADHYLNKVFIYILPVKTTIPHHDLIQIYFTRF